jgi:hypothetical protein
MDSGAIRSVSCSRSEENHVQHGAATAGRRARPALRGLRAAGEDVIRSIMTRQSPIIEVPRERMPPFRSQWLRQGLTSDLATLLAMLQKEPFYLLKSGKLPKRLLDLAAARLECVPVGGDLSRYLDFVLDTSLELGLLRTSQRQLHVTERVESWLGRPLVHPLRECYELWLESTHWDELYRLPGIKVESTGLRTAPKQARRFVIEALAQLPPGQWVGLQDLLERLREQAPFFYRPLRDERNWRVRPEGPGAAELLLGEGGWYEIEGRLVAAIVAEPAHWLGMTALGFGEDGTLQSVQLTRLGAVLVGALDEHELHAAPPLEEVHLQPNFEILVPQEVDLAVRYHIERFAERLGTDRVLTYRLTRATVLAALTAGESMDGFIAFLQQHSSKELPQNVLYSLRSWSSLFGQLSVRPAVLLEAREPERLEELLHDEALGALLRGRLGQRFCEVEPEQLEALLGRLQEAGHLPRLDESLQSAEHGSVSVDDQEAYCLVLGLLFLREQAVLHRMSPRDQSIESLLSKLGRINDGEVLEQAAEDFQRIQKERTRRHKQAQSIIAPEHGS